MNGISAAPGGKYDNPVGNDGLWEQVAGPCAFSIRDTAEPFLFRDMMWLSNGYEKSGVLVRDLWRSADGITWIRVLENTPYNGYSEIVLYHDRLWAVKGSVWNSDDGIVWKQVSPKTPFGSRGYGELVVFKDRMWQLGSGRDVWHTQDGANWECAQADAPFGDRYASAVAVYDGRLWLMGGATNQSANPPEMHYAKYTTHNDIWCSGDGNTWTRVQEHAPWAPRMWVVAAVYAGRLWIIGGFSNRQKINFADAWSTKDGLSWQAHISAPMFSPRHEVSPFVYRGSLWVVAGNSWPLTNDVWRLTLPEGRAARQ